MMLRFISYAFLLFACGFVFADASYTLDECLREGFERSLILSNAVLDEGISEDQIQKVRSQALPSLNLDAIYTRIDEVFPSGPNSSSSGYDDTYSVNFGLKQLLYSGGGVRAALKAAKMYRQFTEEQTRNIRLGLERDITIGFYAVLFAEAARDTMQQSVDQLEAIEQETHLKYKTGTVSEYDWLFAKVKLANERPKLIQTGNNLKLERSAFRDLLYWEKDKEFTLDGSLGFKDIFIGQDQLTQWALVHRPEVLRARLLVEMREQEVVAASSGWKPELNAFANYRNQESSASNDGDWHWNAGLQASWSLFDSGNTHAEWESKKREQLKAQHLLEELERQVVFQIQQAWIRMKNAEALVESAEEGIVLAERALAIAKVQYEHGLVASLDYTQSNLELSQARLVYYSALNEHWQALANLAYACGSRELVWEADGNHAKEE